MKVQPGEVWFVELGMAEKPRWAFVVAAHDDGRLALASVVTITTQFAGTPYEVTLPRVPWLREQSYVNAQTIQPVRLVELTRRAQGKFDGRVLVDVSGAVKRWLNL